MSTELPTLHVTAVKAGEGCTVIVRFDNGKMFSIDLSELIGRVRGLRPLAGRRLFVRVAVGEDGHSIAWPGELDVGADRLFELALEQSGRAANAEFIRWRWRNALSLTSAAAALGLSRRQVAYYASGAHEVPLYILLACKGWEQERHAVPIMRTA